MPESALAVQDQPPRTTALAVPADAEDAGKMVQVAADAEALRDAIALGAKPQEKTREISPDLRQRIGKITEPLIAVAIDQTRDFEDKVREQVNRQYTKNVNENMPQNLVGRTFRRLKDNFKKNNDRLKLRQEARDAILESQNIYYFNGDEAEGREANRVTHGRFMELRTNDVISEEAGESRHEFSGDNDPYVTGFRELMRKYVNGDYNKEDGTDDEDKFNEAAAAFLKEYRAKEGTDHVGEGTVQTHNFLTVGRQIRERIKTLTETVAEHTESIAYTEEQLEQIRASVINSVRTVAGQAHTSVYKGPEYSKTDEFIDKMSERRGFRWVSPELIAAACTAAAITLRVAGAKGASAITGGAGAAVGAGLAYARERKTLKDERAQHESETAVGAEFAANAKRRNKMEEFAYDTVEARGLIENLGQFTIKRNELADNSDEAFQEALAGKFKTKEDIQAALSVLADVEARVRISNRSRGENGKTLISFSSELGKEEERLELGIARASVKFALETRLANGGRELFDENELPPEKSFAAVLQDYEQAREKTLLAAAEKQDAAFNSYSVKRSLRVAALTGLASAAISGIVSSGVDAMSHSETVTSAVNTAKEHFTKTSYAGGASIEINGGYNIVSHDGLLSVKDSAGNLMPGLDVPVDAQGHISPALLDKINAQPGLHVENLSTTGPAGPSLSLDQYAAQHPTEFKHLNVAYENNNTATYDLNEQGGRLSMNSDGTVTIGQSMTADGSFNATSSIDMTRGQNMLDMSFKQPDGSMIHKTFAYGQPIPKPWADMLYQKPDGNWGFKGNGEVHWGKESNGTFYAAASLAGDGQSMTVPGVPTETVHYKITVDVPQTAVVESGIAAPLIVPMPLQVVRRELEAPVEKTPPQEQTPTQPTPELIIEVPPTGRRDLALIDEDNQTGSKRLQRAIEGKRTLGHEERLALKAAPLALERGKNEARETLLRDALPELKMNPEAHISLGAALDHHRTVMEGKDPEFMQGIDNELQYNATLENLATDSDAIVPWTVKAPADIAMVLEGLTYYGERARNGHDKFHLLINIVSTDEQDTELRDNLIALQQMMGDVQTKYPELAGRFSNMSTFIEKAKLESDAYAGRSLEELGDERSYEVIMEATRRAVESGARAADSDILILRRPPTVALDAGYEDRMIDAMKQNPEKDMFNGGVRWGLYNNNIYERVPSLGFLTNAMETMRIVGRHTTMPNFQPLDVVNMGCRLSTIAAVGGGGHYTDPRGSKTYDLALVARLAAARQSASTKAHTMYVTNAQVNISDTSIFEATQIFGGSITDAVDALRDGELTHDLATVAAEDRIENLETMNHVVIKQVEHGMTDILNNLQPSDAVCRTAFAFLLPMDIEKNGEGRITKINPLYRISKKDGKRTFIFTNSGAKWLLDQFSHNPRYRGVV